MQKDTLVNKKYVAILWKNQDHSKCSWFCKITQNNSKMELCKMKIKENCTEMSQIFDKLVLMQTILGADYDNFWPQVLTWWQPRWRLQVWPGSWCPPTSSLFLPSHLSYPSLASSFPPPPPVHMQIDRPYQWLWEMVGRLQFFFIAIRKSSKNKTLHTIVK